MSPSYIVLSCGSQSIIRDWTANDGEGMSYKFQLSRPLLPYLLLVWSTRNLYGIRTRDELRMNVEEQHILPLFFASNVNLLIEISALKLAFGRGRADILWTWEEDGYGLADEVVTQI